MESVLAVSEICMQYNTNRLTLGQTYLLLMRTQEEFIVDDARSIRLWCAQMCHMVQEADRTAIEVGYEGDFLKWLADGHRPRHWQMTRGEAISAGILLDGMSATAKVPT